MKKDVRAVSGIGESYGTSCPPGVFYQALPGSHVSFPPVSFLFVIKAGTQIFL
jgi:hypothetical protein